MGIQGIQHNLRLKSLQIVGFFFGNFKIKKILIIILYEISGNDKMVLITANCNNINAFTLDLSKILTKRIRNQKRRMPGDR